MEHAQGHSGVRTRTGQTKGRSNGKKDEAKNSTAYDARYGFLRHSFSPLAEIPKEIQDRKQVEREYFTSLQNLAALYGFGPLDVSENVYPFNIKQSFEWAKEELQKCNPKLQLIIVQDEKHKACLATAKVFSTGYMLYYIPIKPLYDLLNSKRVKEARLLLSVFSYLYQKACVPHYAGDNGFLQCQYEMIQEWLCQEPDNWDAPEYGACLSEIRMAEYFGAKLLKQMSHPYHLEQFEKRVRGFAPVNEKQMELLECSQKILQLFHDHSGRPFYANIEQGLLAPDEEERISPEQYLSFIWSSEGWLFEQLHQQVNCSLQEMTEADEPTALQYFDTPEVKESHDLDFESRVFALIDELIYVLNKIV